MQSQGLSRIASPGSMQDTGCLGLMHWDDPEGWYGEGGALEAAQGAPRDPRRDSRGERSPCVQLSHPYMTTGKTIALTRWTFVDKVMSLFFNMLSRLVITFLPRSKRKASSCVKECNFTCLSSCSRGDRHLLSCMSNLRSFPDDARGCQCPFVLCLHPHYLRIGVWASPSYQERIGKSPTAGSLQSWDRRVRPRLV